jgi:hypothetical protein
MNQKIAGSSPARIYRVLCDKDLDRLVGVLVRNVIHYVPVLLPNHHLKVHNVFHYVPITPPPPPQHPFFRTFKKSTAPNTLHNMGLWYIKN